MYGGNQNLSSPSLTSHQHTVGSQSEISSCIGVCPIPKTVSSNQQQRLNKWINGLNEFLVAFGLIFCVWWIVLFTFNPQIVRVMYCEEEDLFPHPKAPPDPVKCLMFSVIFTTFVVIIIWIINGFFIHPF